MGVFVIEQYRDLVTLVFLADFLHNAGDSFTANHALRHQFMNALHRFLLF